MLPRAEPSPVNRRVIHKQGNDNERDKRPACEEPLFLQTPHDNDCEAQQNCGSMDVIKEMLKDHRLEEPRPTTKSKRSVIWSIAIPSAHFHWPSLLLRKT